MHSVGEVDSKMPKHGASKERGAADGDHVDSKREPPYDRYKFLERLGEGTYGVVYKGIFKETGEVSISSSDCFFGSVYFTRFSAQKLSGSPRFSNAQNQEMSLKKSWDAMSGKFAEGRS